MIITHATFFETIALESFLDVEIFHGHSRSSEMALFDRKRIRYPRKVL